MTEKEPKTFFGRLDEKVCPKCGNKEFRYIDTASFQVNLRSINNSFSHTMIFKCKKCETEIRQSAGTNNYPPMP